MASTSGKSTAVIILIIAIINTFIVTAVREGELTVMLSVLRARGYHLFANAISTSDVHYDLKSDHNNYTLLAPINSALFALDMTMPTTNYVTTLRYHILPRRMSMIHLLSLPPGSNSVPTLVTGRDVVVEQRRSVRSLITVGGVDIVVPGMFYGREIAVHGLGGILEYRHHARHPPANVSDNFTLESPNRSSHSSPVYNITGNYTFKFPVAIESPLSSHRKLNQTVSSPETLSPADGNDTYLAPSTDLTEFIPIRTASVDFIGEELTPRSKLLEVSSGSTYDLIPGTKSTGVDDITMDCSLDDNVADQMNTRIHPRRMNIPSNMICDQK